jgi:signal peptidase II
VAVVWLVADQLTKHWAVNELTDRNIDIIGSLRFNLAFNRGMAFSQGEGLGPVIAILAMLIVVALLVGLRTTGSRVAAFATGMVLGGAVGNLVDRMFRRGGDGVLTGAVVDFIDVQWWPIFNIADIGVVVGAIVLLLTAWRADRTPVAPG